MDVHPTKNVSIGIDPYPHRVFLENPSSATTNFRQTQQKACPACQTQQKVSKTRNRSQSTTGRPAILKKWFRGNSMRIVENTQNAPINQNCWNTLMPLQPV